VTEQQVKRLRGKTVERVEKSPIEGYLIYFDDGTVIWWRA
jgi:hypothetical protein